MCAAGPPKAVAPKRKNSVASSRSELDAVDVDVDVDANTGVVEGVLCSFRVMLASDRKPSTRA